MKKYIDFSKTVKEAIEKYNSFITTRGIRTNLIEGMETMEDVIFKSK